MRFIAFFFGWACFTAAIVNTAGLSYDWIFQNRTDTNELVRLGGAALMWHLWWWVVIDKEN